jgi:drug/metabolite transporter (DMT)-like permease
MKLYLAESQAIGVGVIFNAEFEQFYGILIALLSAFLSALFTILNNQMVKHALPITLSFYELLVGTLVCGSICYVFWELYLEFLCIPWL